MEKYETFSFGYLNSILTEIKFLGYQFKTMSSWTNETSTDNQCFLRVDVDFDPSKLVQLLDVFRALEIRATFFLRVISPSYNPFSIAMLEIYKRLENEGHEIGLHHDSIVGAALMRQDPKELFILQKKLLELVLGHPIKGSSSHGSLAPQNNQDLFKTYSKSDLGLAYEAYDLSEDGIFANTRYVSDSQWTSWKSYQNGVLIDDDKRNPAEHASELMNKLYILIHPDTYFSRHQFESFQIGS
jgi:hypothetical protein